ncbi:MAG: nickel-dependent lactate racemase [Deltaproteobacteria bacterium]|nr:nickel-dependent lactate racemase [Deltaproteobacteria bacterium]
METREIHLKYGRGEVVFSLPAGQIYFEVVGKDYPAVSDIPGAIKSALEKPIDSPPLKEMLHPTDKVAIAVSDITRSWQRMDLVLPTLLDTISEAGVPDGNINILVVVGGHRQNTKEEMVLLCGREVADRVNVVNHNARDLENMVYLGKTSRGTEVAINRVVAEADRIILTGGIIYHYMVGYGGGRKSVIPGFSSIKTIQQNHLWAMGRELGSGSNPNARSGKTSGNECHEDMMEIAGLVRPDFIVNVVPNAEEDYAGIFAGNWVSAWREGTKRVDEIYSVPIPGLADIVIASAGGFPKDINLYQTGKTMDNACYAVKQDGAVIIISECLDIREPPEFPQWFQYGSRLEMERALRADFTIPGWVAWKEVECSDRASFIMVTLPQNADLVRRAGMIPVGTIREALEIAYRKCGTKEPRITLMPQGANTLPVILPPHPAEGRSGNG